MKMRETQVFPNNLSLLLLLLKRRNMKIVINPKIVINKAIRETTITMVKKGMKIKVVESMKIMDREIMITVAKGITGRNTKNTISQSMRACQVN